MSSHSALYQSPHTLEDALQFLSQHEWHILAGGTDFYPARVGKPIKENILDLSNIKELNTITHQTDGQIHIGAGVTWSQLLQTTLPPHLAGLQTAAYQIGGQQIQNAGTLVGNICNASPAADGIPPLLALDAEIELQSAQGRRRVPLASFILGNRRTVKTSAELVIKIIIPAKPNGTQSRFIKLGYRRYLVISLAMVGITFTLDQQQKIQVMAIAVGACGPVACRLPALEKKYLGLTLAQAYSLHTSPDDLKVLSPINDVRGSAEYRLEVVPHLIRELLQMPITAP